ncbi:PREDICTED: transmembrane protein 154 [Cyprinodon variegatus]|uniref:transmembrane protein 154 n=1 Tax=Cyprinodon variegatus TaxID=28743 RepID=UPI0007428C93|nr:PREDICTED: transmembrane protein 154 [Cyprinodon variegatus]
MIQKTPPVNTSEPDTASGSGDIDEQAVSDQGVSGTTVSPEEPDYTTYILIAVVAVVVIAGAIICGIVIMHRHRQKGGNKELSKVDPVLDGSSTEKVPMPMFEEDVPSVLELEMDELDQWMKKDS